MPDYPFLDLLERALDRAEQRHFFFDDVRHELECRRRDDLEFLALVRDALNLGMATVLDWEKQNRGPACVRTMLDRLEWELRFREMTVLVGRRICA